MIDDNRPAPNADLRTTPLNQWACQHPWHPRVGPWFAYMAFLALLLYARDWRVQTYAPLKVVQAAAVCWLIWRWRKLVPELNWRFHWSVLPVSVFLTAAWVGIGSAMEVLFPTLARTEPDFFAKLYGSDRTWFWAAAVTHLLAMVTAVPMIEETFNRSLLLRSLHRARQTGTGLLQIICDFPVIGDWLIHTRLGTRATQQPAVFGSEFERTPLGALSVFGVLASSLVFAMVHVTRDQPAAILCGVTWCLMLRYTRDRGLGPVIWSHALTNLLLWAYVIYVKDWRFI